jgi:thioredoxin-related protein
MSPAFLQSAIFTLIVLILSLPGVCSANTVSKSFEEEFENEFNDQPLSREIEHPEWFKESFLDLREDLEEAKQAGKKGIALYFGQKHCAYCKALMEINFTKPDIVDYVREHFDIIPLDIWGSRTVTMFDGSEITESELAALEQTNFTPSLIFYDEKGEVAYKMRGYYKPYRFQAVMKYVVENFYRGESFRDYLERANPPPKFSDEELNEHDQVVRGPVILDRRAAPGSKPLAVLFEQQQCHACDQLHSEPLNNETTKQWLKGFELRQLDAWSNTPVVTPDGQHLTAREWASRLGIHYMPTTVFFDEQGNEILRIDSVVKLYRMRSLLSFILTNGYKNHRTFQHWRRYTSVER